MAEIKIFKRFQNMPISSELKEAIKDEMWQCDIYASGGNDHHGVGPSPEVAADRAMRHWLAYEKQQTPAYSGPLT